jgi:hypothetical protein
MLSQLDRPTCRKSTRDPRRHHARPGVEQVERRDAPSYLAFGTAYLAGSVFTTGPFNGLSASSYYLPYGNRSGTLAWRSTSSLATTSGSFSYANNQTDTLRLEEATSANAGNYSYATARTNLSQYNNGGAAFVTVTVKPGAGDYIGRPVRIAFSCSYQSTVSGNASNFTQLSISDRYGQHDRLLGSTNVQGAGRTYSGGTYTFDTTVGSSFSICMTSVSTAYSAGAVASGLATITITTQSR